jgi:hypothetical protein
LVVAVDFAERSVLLEHLVLEIDVGKVRLGRLDDVLVRTAAAALDAARAGLATRVRLAVAAFHVANVGRLAQLDVGKHGRHLDAFLDAERLILGHLPPISAHREQLIVQRQVVGLATAARLGLALRRLLLHLAVTLADAAAAVRVTPRGRVLVDRVAQRAVALVLGATRRHRVGVVRIRLGQLGVDVVAAQAAVAAFGRGARAGVRVIAAFRT